MHFHDASLQSIDIRDGETVLRLRGVDESVHHIYLRAVKRLRGLDFREGNIVFEIEVTAGSMPSMKVLRRLFDLEENEHPDFLEKFAKGIEKGDLTLVHLTPSYGCELIALCKSCTIE